MKSTGQRYSYIHRGPRLLRPLAWILNIVVLCLVPISAPISATAQESPVEQAEIGRALGELFQFMTDLSRLSRAKEPEEPSRSLECPKGTDLLTPDPMVCIGERPPTLPNHPKLFEFKLCTKLRDAFICLPGYFHCNQEKEQRVCEISITTPPLMPPVKCEIKAHPDGGTTILCSFPAQDNPFQKAEETLRVTYPEPGRICLRSLSEKDDVCFPSSLFPTLKPVIERLPGYPTGTLESKALGDQSSWD